MTIASHQTQGLLEKGLGPKPEQEDDRGEAEELTRWKAELNGNQKQSLSIEKHAGEKKRAMCEEGREAVWLSETMAGTPMTTAARAQAGRRANLVAP